MTAQLNRYAQEHIELNNEKDGSNQNAEEEETQSPELLVDLLDRAPQSAVVRATASVTNLRDAANATTDRRGFLWLLDDEALMSATPTAEEELLDKLTAMYPDRESEKLFGRPVDGAKNRLVLHHGQGTNSVTYHLDGWLKAAREIPTSRNAAFALTESNKFVSFELLIFIF